MTSEIAEPVIAYKPVYARIQGVDGKPLGTDAALFLCQALYWSERYPDGFYKSSAAWEQETGLTRDQQRTARKKLCDMGLLIEWEKGFPLTLHFRVVRAALEQVQYAPVGGKSPTAPVGDLSSTAEIPTSRRKIPNQYAENPQSVGGKSPTVSNVRARQKETTEETTEEITQRESAPAARRAQKSPREDTTALREWFDTVFWPCYPNSAAKKPAWEEMSKINPDEATRADIMAGLHQARASPQWRRDSGQYVPHARTWLHQRRWEDGANSVLPGLEKPYAEQTLEERKRHFMQRAQES